MREFRDHFPLYDKPVKVITTRGGVRVIGTWHPEPRKQDAKPSG